MSSASAFASWIIWRDEDLVAVNKPAGILSQAADGDRGENLVSLAREYFKRGHIGVLHRLDRNVSGIVLLALNAEAARDLSLAFASGNVQRDYVAVSRGVPTLQRFVIDAPLLKDPKTNEVTVVDRKLIHTFSPEKQAQIRESKTDVRVRESFSALGGKLSVLDVSPITGRSHQIRAHLSYVGLPILGDPKYGVRMQKLDRPLLHARRIEFRRANSKASTVIESQEPWTLNEVKVLRVLKR